MPLPFADIHDDVLSQFGEPAVLRQPGQQDQPVTVVFKARAFEVDAGGEVGVSSSQPLLGLREAGLAQELAPGDAFVLRGHLYNVYDVNRNGEGWARCRAHKGAASE